MTFTSRHPSGRCSHCGVQLKQFTQTLSRSRLHATSGAGLLLSAPVDAASREVLGTYCMKCGREGAAKDEIARRGVSLTNKAVTPWVSVCACCGIKPLDLRESNFVYTVDVEYFNGYFVAKFFEEIFTVFTCSECETQPCDLYADVFGHL
ncbi:hypothetical protein J2W25_006750 [Variovorax boronicumulans]|uniref:Uncharacterized protein n=1 Tax=Variovorax boronicumulans TaxID=436515 RepID=A0AAW8E7J5_9BURK|nr:hypothetical protein [Variovorax boronicumulans]MDP9882410.1 hypothetical protein [Variovorax boronicumulans]MDP9927696.1 hypothetical protein [Variovorax boronicumulans]